MNLLVKKKKIPRTLKVRHSLSDTFKALFSISEIHKPSKPLQSRGKPATVSVVFYKKKQFGRSKWPVKFLKSSYGSDRWRGK